MRSITSSAPIRRLRRQAARRSRRRPAILATGLAFAVLVTAGVTATAPTAQAEASGSFGDFALASFSTPIASDGAAAGIGADDISTAARDALVAADASVTAAATVAADIAASGLDIGRPDTSVDTAALEAAAERLEAGDLLPAPLVPDLTEDVTTLIASVDEHVAALRGSLDAAIALKAEQEAAEKARLEAEAAAAAAAAAEAAAAKQSTSSGSSGSSAPSPVYAAAGTSAADAQAIARTMIAGYGWGDDQFACLVSLWQKESGWNTLAHNRSSGAYGIPQALPGSKMATAGADWQTNAATQISWGLGYISGRYGTPCGAWSHSQSVGWY
ncbi:lytic transglycosylase domain-containing protein [Microbacterium sp. CFH 90308]|uniref:Lytic transglycosylase domain-containing protein n=1 Tax=Microbacterium salsuginis TaxID=2722803 RepID=A0ABX1K9R1_9MICO|nr:lytic transglycosylase domain-containing protein [Microbacterium sp. CFH 90308]NLP82794.1 lytic transglycosylase domain-containing protein [Microbacterium sp. CFH 90308]